MADQAFALHVGDDAELIVARYLGIDTVQLPQVDTLHTESAQAVLDALAQIRRLALAHPLVGPGPHEATLGRNDQALVGSELLSDQAFAHLGAVAVGGIDEVDT